METYILKYNVSSSVSFITRYLDFETLHYYLEYTSDEVMHHILDNVENTKKICFPTQNMSATIVFLEKYTNIVFLRTIFTSVSL